MPRARGGQPSRPSALSRSRISSVSSLLACPTSAPCSSWTFQNPNHLSSRLSSETFNVPGASRKPQFGGCRPPELFCQDVDGTATAVMRGRPPRREGRYQCDRGGVLHRHRRCTVAGGWSDFYPHLSRPDFLSMVTAASS